VIDKINVAFTFIFLAEALMRIVAHGFIMEPTSYLRNGWNLIDATVVVAG
jgi:voltage-dependent calcium channel L type alpha-1F